MLLFHGPQPLFQRSFQRGKVSFFLVEQLQLPLKIFLAVSKLFLKSLELISLPVGLVLKFLFLLVPFILGLEELFPFKIARILLGICDDLSRTLLCTSDLMLGNSGADGPSEHKETGHEGGNTRNPYISFEHHSSSMLDQKDCRRSSQ